MNIHSSHSCYTLWFFNSFYHLPFWLLYAWNPTLDLSWNYFILSTFFQDNVHSHNPLQGHQAGSSFSLHHHQLWMTEARHCGIHGHGDSPGKWAFQRNDAASPDHKHRWQWELSSNGADSAPALGTHFKQQRPHPSLWEELMNFTDIIHSELAITHRNMGQNGRSQEFSCFLYSCFLWSTSPQPLSPYFIPYIF